MKQPLDEIFAAPSHIAVLRVLHQFGDAMSGRAVARAAGLTHQACRLAFFKLEAMRLIERVGGGKRRLIRLNERHQFLRKHLCPLFEAEFKSINALLKFLRARLEGKAEAAALVTGNGRLDLLMSAGKYSKESMVGNAVAFAPGLLSRFGLRLFPVVLTRAELRGRWKSVIEEAVDVLDVRLKDLL